MANTPRVWIRTESPNEVRRNGVRRHLSTIAGTLWEADPEIHGYAQDADNPDRQAQVQISGGSRQWAFPPWYVPEVPEGADWVKPGQHAYIPDVVDGQGATPYGKKLLEDPEFQRTGNAPLWYETRISSPKLSWMESTSGASRVTHALMGAMGREAMRVHGMLPQPDSSLSEDSSRIVKNLQRRGVVEPNPANPEANVTNDISEGKKDPDRDRRVLERIKHGRDGTEQELGVDGEERVINVRPSAKELSKHDVRLGQQFIHKFFPDTKKSVDKVEDTKKPDVMDDVSKPSIPDPTLFDRNWNAE